MKFLLSSRAGRGRGWENVNLGWLLRDSRNTLWRKEILLKKPLAESLTLYSLSRRLRFSSKNKRGARALATLKPVLWLHLRGIRRDCRRVKRVKQSRLCVRVRRGRTRSASSGANSRSGTTKFRQTIQNAPKYMIGANNFAFPAYDVRERVLYNDIAGSDLKIIIGFYREIRLERVMLLEFSNNWSIDRIVLHGAPFYVSRETWRFNKNLAKDDAAYIHRGWLLHDARGRERKFTVENSSKVARPRRAAFTSQPSVYLALPKRSGERSFSKAFRDEFDLCEYRDAAGESITLCRLVAFRKLFVLCVCLFLFLSLSLCQPAGKYIPLWVDNSRDSVLQHGSRGKVPISLSVDFRKSRFTSSRLSSGKMSTDISSIRHCESDSIRESWQLVIIDTIRRK